LIDVANWTGAALIPQIPRMRQANSAAVILPFALLVFTLVAVPLHLFDEQGLPRYRELSDQLAKVQTKNDRLRREIHELRSETDRLRTDPRAIERIARDELGMVREGEVVFQFPN
jgi:cell division protein FtsB